MGALAGAQHEGRWNWRAHLSCPTSVHGIEVRKTRRDADLEEHSIHHTIEHTNHTEPMLGHRGLSPAPHQYHSPGLTDRNISHHSPNGRPGMAGLHCKHSIINTHVTHFDSTPILNEPVETTPHSASNLPLKKHHMLSTTQLAHNRAYHLQAMHWQRVGLPVVFGLSRASIDPEDINEQTSNTTRTFHEVTSALYAAQS